MKYNKVISNLAVLVIFPPVATVNTQRTFTLNVVLVEPPRQALTALQFLIVVLALSQHPAVLQSDHDSLHHHTVQTSLKPAEWPGGTCEIG